MADINKSDIINDKAVVAAFENVNNAIKESSKLIISLIGDMNRLNTSLSNAKGMKDLISTTKEYEKLQQESLKTQQQAILLADKEQKLRLSVSKAVLQEAKAKEQETKESKAAQREADKRAKDLAKEVSLYSQLSKKHIEARNSAKEMAIQYGLNSKEFKKASDEANKLDKELKKIDSSLGQNQRNVGNYTKAIDLVKLGWAAAGAAIIAAGKYILDLNVKFSKASASLRAITGATLADMKFYEAQAKAMGKQFGIAADEMLKSFERVGSIRPELLKTKEALVQVTESAIVLSQASGGMLDLAGATEALGAGMNQFNLTAKDSDRIINALAAGSQIGSAEVSSLAESFKNVGAVADSANMSLEDTVAALEVLGEKSLYGAEAGTKLRGTILKLQEAGKGFASGKFNLKDALIETKAQLDAIASPIERASYLQKMFGIENQTAGIIMLQNIDKYTKFREGVEGTNVAFDQQKIQMDTISGAWAKLGSTWDSILTSGWFSQSVKWIIQFTNAMLSGERGTMADGSTTVSRQVAAFNKELKDLEGQGLTSDQILAKLQKRLSDVSGFEITRKAYQEQYDIYKKNIDATKEQNEIALLRWDMSNKTTAQLLIENEANQKQIDSLNNLIGGFGEYDVAKQDQIATAKLNIKAIDQEIKARQKLESSGGKGGSIGLTEAQIKANLEATKKYKAESDKMAETFFDEWERVEKINIKKSEDAKAQKLKDEKDYQDASLKQSEEFLDEAMRIEQKRVDKEAENAQLIKDTKNQLATDAWNTGKDLVDTMFAIQQNNYDKETKQITDKYDLQENALKKQLDNDKLTVESRAQIEGQLKAMEAKKAEDLKAIEVKKRESQRKQFIVNKAIAIAEITMNTAQAVIKTLANIGAPWGIPLAIAAGVLGTAQAAVVIAQPMPAFDKGTDYAPHKDFLVGEVRPEFVTHKGQTQLITEPTIMHNMGGAVVTSGVETQRILEANQKARVWSSFNKGEQINNKEQIAEQRETNRLLKQQKQVKIFVSGNVSGYAEMGNATLRQLFRG